TKPELWKSPDSPFHQVRFYVGDPKTGKRIRIIRSTFETNAEKASALMEGILADVLEKLYASDKQKSSKQPLGDFIEEYFRKHGGALAEPTKQDYRRSVT